MSRGGFDRGSDARSADWRCASVPSRVPWGQRGSRRAVVVQLRGLLGSALRGRRVGQQRTLREVADRAGVSLGYLSEVERGRKEASSELLGAICTALDLRLSDLLREVSDALAVTEAAATTTAPAAGADPATNRESGEPARQRADRPVRLSAAA
jgi:transcriptional regulator with XRE-family HTH domain